MKTQNFLDTYHSDIISRYGSISNFKDELITTERRLENSGKTTELYCDNLPHHDLAVESEMVEKSFLRCDKESYLSLKHRIVETYKERLNNKRWIQMGSFGRKGHWLDAYDFSRKLYKELVEMRRTIRRANKNIRGIITIVHIRRHEDGYYFNAHFLWHSAKITQNKIEKFWFRVSGSTTAHARRIFPRQLNSKLNYLVEHMLEPLQKIPLEEYVLFFKKTPLRMCSGEFTLILIYRDKRLTKKCPICGKKMKVRSRYDYVGSSKPPPPSGICLHHQTKLFGGVEN